MSIEDKGLVYKLLMSKCIYLMEWAHTAFAHQDSAVNGRYWYGLHSIAIKVIH